MRPFIKNVAFVSLPQSISYLLGLREQDKKILHDAVDEGIETRLIRPVEELTLRGTTIKIEKYVRCHLKEMSK